MGSAGVRKNRKATGEESLTPRLRREMVREIGAVYGLDSPRVFSALLSVPRENFVPGASLSLAYKDEAVPIGHGQTLSQPYTVAFMTHLLDLDGTEKVLEIGTGSGYQAAILARLAGEVFSVERVGPLARRARSALARLGLGNVHVKKVGKEVGWKEKGPYGAILVTAGMEKVPDELFDQLGPGGVLVAPVGPGEDKTMTRYIKANSGLEKEEFGTFHFVPFVEN